MATFFIQVDKPFYFAGETVNGFVYVNVGAMIVGAQGLSLKFTGYECVKWVEAQELHRPDPYAQRPPNTPPPYDPIAHIPPHEILNSDVPHCSIRILISQIANPKETTTTIFDQSTSEHLIIDTTK